MKNNLNHFFSLKTTTFLCLNVWFCLGTFNANAQQTKPAATPPPTAQEQVISDEEVIKVDSRLVVVPVSVTDANGEPVKNLAATDFQLDEEGRRQQVAEISTADQVPLEIALLIDVSSSVNSLFEYEKDAAARFLQNVMKPEDRASVFLVGDAPKMIQARDTAEKTAATVRAINPTKNYTAFFDTVDVAVDYLKKNSPKQSRRVILTLSDGEDTYSKSTLVFYEKAYKEMGAKLNTLTQEKRLEILNRYRLQASDQNTSNILRDLQNADTVFYSVNPAGSSLKLNQISLRGQTGLQKFADETGGTAFLPQILSTAVARQPVQNQENERLNREALDRIFRQIAAELRAQYLLQYYSDSTFETGKYVRLKVQLPTKTVLRVRARQGYFADTVR